MVSLVLALCLIGFGGQALSAVRDGPYNLEEAEVLFEEFIKTFNKKYAHEAEKNMRLEIFKKNLVKCNEKNELHKTSYYGKYLDIQ